MATYVGKESFVLQNSSSLTVTKPSGAVAGDLLVLHVISGDLGSNAYTLTLPSGWTLIDSYNYNSGSRSVLMTRTCEAGDSTWQFTASSTIDWCYVMAAYREAVLGGVQRTVDGDGNSSANLTGIDLCGMALALVGIYNASPLTTTWPSGWTEIVDHATNRPTYRDLSEAAAHKEISGATGSVTINFSNNAQAVVAWLVGVNHLSPLRMVL